jgi:predicted trehalose synthase
MLNQRDGGRRVIVSGVEPEIDSGRFPIRRTEGETVNVESDVFRDGHDAISCALLYRRDDDAEWSGTWRSASRPAPLLPPDRGEFDALLAAYLIEKAGYEVLYELNNRPGWVGIPLRGIERRLR